MKKVTQKEYHNRFMNLDAVMSVDFNNGLATTTWSLRGYRNVIAKSVEDINANETEYFIN